jgi:3-(methylthio)propionyl---CoA ligase
MLGLMMDRPLSIPSVLQHAARFHSRTQIVSRNLDGSLHRYDYKTCYARTAQLAHALKGMGLKLGDRIATLAWNHYRHLELYFAVPGMGMVCHTVNPRLFREQIEFILNDADDQYVFVDPMFAALIEAIIPQTPKIRGVIFLCNREEMPQTTLKHVICYEDLLEGKPDHMDWPELDERTASGLCYTSGTTGNPKGVLYSHRSTLLHAMTAGMPNVLGLGSSDVYLPVVPMFHVNAWGSPYAATMAGIKQVMPGPRLDGASLIELIHTEGITCTAGVPTVWLGLLNAANEAKVSLKPLKRVLVGGSACPQSMFEAFAAHEITPIHAWGMTETSPLGAVSALGPEHMGLPAEDQMKRLLKQGRAPYGIEMRIVSSEGQALPWDGVSRGELQARGLWVTSGYFNQDNHTSFTNNGWFSTGDIATIDEEGFMQIVDRLKDVIKSGGEWISSIEIENLALSHPSIREAAVIARDDPQWTERPRLIMCLKNDQTLIGRDLLAILAPKLAKWWLPDDFIIVDELPHTATGKLLKTKLRELYGQYEHPKAQKLV